MRNMIIRKLSICSITLFVLILLYIFPSNKNNVVVTYNEVDYDIVYLLYDNYLVQEQVLSLSNNINDKIYNIIDSLTIDGNNKNHINDSFKAVLPKNTKLLDFTLNNKLLKLNFNKELLNTSLEDEVKMIESIVFSLTELDEIDKVMIFVDSNKLERFPNSKKFLPVTLDRNFGINKVYEITTLNNVSSNTLYYYINIDDSNKLVPVSIYSNNDINKVEVIIDELKSAPIYQSNLMSFLSENAKLLDYELLENKIKLEFDNDIMESFFKDKVIEEVKYAISLSLKDSLGIEEVSFFIQNNQI